MDGGTYGAGTTLAGGVGNWFALLDMNYTYTSIAAIDGNIKTFVAAPRVGYRWQYDGGRELRVFVGAMYQNVQQELSGDLKSLNLPPQLLGLVENLSLMRASTSVKVPMRTGTVCLVSNMPLTKTGRY